MPGEFRPPRYESPQQRLPNGERYPTAGVAVGRWMQRNLVHAEGDVLGEKVRLTPFDRYWLCRALEHDPITGRLLYDRVIIGVGKGNAKTEGMGRFSVADLVGPIAPISPRVVISAASYDQSSEAFVAARLAITGTDDKPGPLAPYFLPGLHIMDSRILLPDGHGYIQRIAAVGSTSDGGKPTTHIGDELHEWTTEAQERVWTVQSKSLRKRVVPRRTPSSLGLPPGVKLHGALQFGITTAGVDPDTLLGRLYAHGVSVALGDVVDESFLFLWWEADDALDLEDPEQLDQALLQANPCVGEFMPIENKRRSFRDLTVARADALRYDLNRWSTDEERWIRNSQWQACQGDTTPIPAEPAFAAISIAHEHRAAAVAVAQRDGEGCRLRVATFPEKGIARDVVPVETLEEHIRALRALYPAPVVAVRRAHPKAPERRYAVGGPELVYNGSFFEGSAQRLDAVGMALWSIPESMERIAPAAEAMRGLVIEGRLAHDGGQELARQVGLVLADPSAKGWRIQDAGPAARAAMIAVNRAMTAPRVPRSNGRGNHGTVLE